MITGNKWERSEFYVFLKLLLDGELPLWDRKLNIMELPPLHFKKLLRYDWWEKKEYHYSNEDNEIIISQNNWIIAKVEVKWFDGIIHKLFHDILENPEGTFSLVTAEELLRKLQCLAIKQDSQEKSDLNGIVIDENIWEEVEAWFSIKSSIWWLSTLLNASMQTNFKFRIDGLSKETILNIAGEYVHGPGPSSHVKEVVKAIYEKWWSLNFCKWENSHVFEENLMKIDSLMPDIIWEVLKSYYRWLWSKLLDIVPTISEFHKFVENLLTEENIILNLKKLLIATASVMMPNTPWDWFRTGAKWYIIVKLDGNLVGFYLYNDDEFWEYLINNTKLDTPSTSRYWIWMPAFEDDRAFLYLNLQMRFVA